MEVPGKRGRGIAKQKWSDIIRTYLSERMERNTELNGGVSYETSTPHKNAKGCERGRSLLTRITSTWVE